MRTQLIGMDPPQHVKYRRLVQRGFTPRMVAKLEPRIRAYARRGRRRAWPRAASASSSRSSRPSCRSR